MDIGVEPVIRFRNNGSLLRESPLHKPRKYRHVSAIEIDVAGCVLTFAVHAHFCFKTLQSVQNDALFLYYLADVLPRNRLFPPFVAFLLPESTENCLFGRYKRQFPRKSLFSFLWHDSCSLSILEATHRHLKNIIL